jgi:hypothetical protein
MLGFNFAKAMSSQSGWCSYKYFLTTLVIIGNESLIQLDEIQALVGRAFKVIGIYPSCVYTSV